PDDERRPARARLGEQVLERAADGDDVAGGRPDAGGPEPADVLVGAVAGVVRREGEPLPGRPQGGDRLGRAGRRLATDPDAAVEVEDELVVAVDERAEAHGAAIVGGGPLAFGAVPRLALLIALVLALGLAACGSDDDGGEAATGADADAAAQTTE